MAQYDTFHAPLLQVTDSTKGTNSAVIAGINYVVNDFKSRAAACPNGFVVSMSLGGAKSASVNSAAAQLVSQGIFLAVAAGNDAVDASNVSPGSEPSAFTVAAMDSTDTFATQFSNFGPLVDLLAPGVAVLSTWILNKTVSLQLLTYIVTELTFAKEHTIRYIYGNTSRSWPCCILTWS